MADSFLFNQVGIYTLNFINNPIVRVYSALKLEDLWSSPASRGSKKIV